MMAISSAEDAMRALNTVESYIRDDLPALEAFSRLHGPRFAEIRRLKRLLDSLERFNRPIFYGLGLEVQGRIGRAATRMNQTLVLECPEQDKSNKQKKKNNKYPPKRPRNN